MAKPVEQQVILDADGKPIFDALALVQRQLGQMKATMAQIHQMNSANARRYNQQLANQTKEIQQQQQMIRTQAAGRNSAGFNIQDASGDQRLGQATRKATEYQRSIVGVSSAIDGLRAKENDLNRAIAERGRQNKFATVGQQRQTKVYADQVRMLQQLDRELARVQRKKSSNNLTGGDRRAVDAEFQKILKSRQSVTNAALAPNRRNIERELLMFQQSLDNFNSFVTRRRQTSAQRVRDERRAAREIEAIQKKKVRDEQRNKQALERLKGRGRLDDRTSEATQRAREITDYRRLQLAISGASDRMSRLRILREQSSTPKMYRQRTMDIQVEKAYTRALERQMIALNKRDRARGPQNAHVQAFLAQGGGGAGGSGGGGGAAAAAGGNASRNGSVGTILSPGYAAAAIARTGVYGAAAAAIYGLFNTMRDGARFVVEFEDGMVRLQAISASTTIQMEQLEQSILGIARGSRFSTVELIKVSTILAQAGVTADQMTEVLNSVINLATASGSSTEESVQLVTSAIGAFQLQTGEAARVADLMTVALNRTKLTVQQTGLAIQYVGASAFENNITLEQLLATSAALAQAGVKSGSTIGTGFRRFLVDLRTPTKKLTEEFERLGLTQADVDVKTRGLGAVLETLRDAGFGATAAYAGLETRSAAFYLVAKNNLDIVDQLQLAFTAQNAAQEASGVAMDSLTAQGQRFSNVMGEVTNLTFEPMFEGLKDGLKSWSDDLDEALDRAKKNGNSFWYEFFQDDDEDTRRQADIGADSIFDGAGFMGMSPARIAWEMEQRDLEKQVEASERAIARMETALNEANDAFYSQGNIVAQVEKEYERLLTQKDNYIDNEIRTQAETLTLAGRFEGLSKYLGQMKDGYEDLTNALNQYRQAQNGLLEGAAATYQGQLRLQNQSLNSSSRELGDSIIQSGEYDQLTTQEKQAVLLLRSWAMGTEFDGDRKNRVIQAIATIGDATGREGVGYNISTQLNRLGVNANQRISNEGMDLTVEHQRKVAAWRGNTERGRAFTEQASQIESLLQRAEPLDNITDSDPYREAGRMLDALDRIMAPEANSFYETGVNVGRTELRSLRQQYQGLALRQKDREEEAARSASGRTPDQMIRFDTPVQGQRTSGFGMRQDPITGRQRRHGGVDYSAPEGTGISAAAAGIVKDVRFSETYGWMVELDHGAGTTTRYAHMVGRPDDLEIGQEVSRGQQIGRVGSTGRSTGNHLHFEALRNGRAADPSGEFASNVDDYRRRSGSYIASREREQQRFSRALDRRGVQIAQKNMTESLEEMAESSSLAAFQAASDRGLSALSELKNALRNQAENDLMRQGIGPGDPEWDNRMDQLDAQIEQTIDDYNDRIAKGLIDNLRSATKLAASTFEQAIAPAQSRLKAAEGQAAGLSLRSNSVRGIPDYVATLAQDRVAQAQEGLVQARSNAIPAQIAELEDFMRLTRERIALLPEEQQQNSALNEELNKQQIALAGLRAEYANLQAQLGAGDLVPSTIKEGLNQAIEAYRIQNQLGRTFKEEIIFNLGGGLEQAHKSINTFFTDILTGSKSVLDAFGDMVLGIIDYLGKLAAQFVANQIFGVLLNVLGAAVGGLGTSVGGPAGNTNAATSGGIGASANFLRGFTGGTPRDLPQLNGGGRVTNGAVNRDSVHALIARDEWVVQSSAVRSVGDRFMADLNNHGAQALDALQQPVMNVMPQEGHTTNVWLVTDEDKPAMGPNDVLVVMHDDLVNGTGRRLVKSITQGG